MTAQPDFKKIYSDLIQNKFPEKMEKCIHFFTKEDWTSLDVLKINSLIFEYTNNANGKYKSYSSKDIIYILNYQKKFGLNNSQLANKFKLSRNTVAKWRGEYKFQNSIF